MTDEMTTMPIDVVLITGCPRSGSTLLAVMLGEIEGYFCAGELRHFWSRGVIGNGSCGCGMQVHDCPVWRAVVDASSFGGWDRIFAQRAIRFQRRLERTRRTRGLAARADSRAPDPELAAYRETLHDLYGAVAAATGCRVLVDSSKNPRYALALCGSPGIRVHVVHLVRDSRGIAYSMQKRKRRGAKDSIDHAPLMPRRSPLRSAVKYDLENSLTHYAGRRGGSYLRVRYEDLVRSPRTVLADISQHIGAGGNDPIPVNGPTLTLRENHTISGNPMRFERGVVALQPDVEWKSRMALSHRILVTAITSPFLVRYGYRLSDSPRRHQTEGPEAS